MLALRAKLEQLMSQMRLTQESRDTLGAKLRDCRHDKDRLVAEIDRLRALAGETQKTMEAMAESNRRLRESRDQWTQRATTAETSLKLVEQREASAIQILTGVGNLGGKLTGVKAVLGPKGAWMPREVYDALADGAAKLSNLLIPAPPPPVRKGPGDEYPH